MSADSRTWTARGTTVIGTAPNEDDITYGPTREPKDPATVDLLREVALQLARTLNGEPPMSDVDKAVLDAVINHQKNSPYPARIGEIADRTGFTRQTVHISMDRLVEAGHGQRPPAGVGQRPFIAHMPEPLLAGPKEDEESR